MTKVFIATPAYDGKVNVQYAVSLAETHLLLNKYGIQVVIQLNAGGSLLVAERNRLIESFMRTDCTHMMCIDSDLGWPSEVVMRMIHHDVDFVGGVYPARGEKSFLFRPVMKEDESLVISEKGLLKMNYIPAGFLLLKREAIQKMIDHFPESYCEPKDKAIRPWYCLFNTEVFEGEFWGEDFVFCRKAREAGIDVWVDPCIEFDHAGLKGSLTSVLTPNREDRLIRT